VQNGKPRIAIVGAGIAGLTTAAAMSRAGLACQVFEQAAELTEVGAGLQLAPNAVRLLRRLGLGRQLDQVAVRPESIEMRRWRDGQLIMRTPLGAECEHRFGAPYLTVHRAHLHQCLRDLLAADVVRLGRRCGGVAESPDAVELTFDGGHTVRADVVAGADGIHSIVRARLVDDRPLFSGQTIYRGLVPAARLPRLASDPRVRLWLGPEQHCVSYPVAGGEWISFGATTPADDGRIESWSATGRVADMIAAYEGWHPEVLELLSAADSVRRWALHDRDAIVRWSTARLTLVGDAAHPMLPFLAQGANQAIEDSVVLAECLRDAAPDSVAGALRRYEALRAPRTAEVQQRSRGNTRALHLADGGAQRDRDAALRDGSGLSTQDWLYGYDAERVAAA
jgi:salicylate hydroxylase